MSALAKAQGAWGDVPDWVVALAEECERTSQNKAAKALGVSATVVSQTLSNQYGAGLGAVEDRVRGVLMREVVECPVVGEIGTDVCRQWRINARQEDLISTMRTTMRIACRRCARNSDSLSRSNSPEAKGSENDPTTI